MGRLLQATLALSICQAASATSALPPDWESKAFARSIAHDDYTRLYRMFVEHVIGGPEIEALKSDGYTPALLIRHDELKAVLVAGGWNPSSLVDPDFTSSPKGFVENAAGAKLVLIHISITRIAPPDGEGIALIALTGAGHRELSLAATSTRTGWIMKKREQK